MTPMVIRLSLLEPGQAEQRESGPARIVFCLLSSSPFRTAFFCRSVSCSFGARYERHRIEMPAELGVFAMSSGLCEVQSGFGTFANANAACYIQKAGR